MRQSNPEHIGTILPRVMAAIVAAVKPPTSAGRDR